MKSKLVLSFIPVLLLLCGCNLFNETPYPTLKAFEPFEMDGKKLIYYSMEEEDRDKVYVIDTESDRVIRTLRFENARFMQPVIAGDKIYVLNTWGQPVLWAIEPATGKSKRIDLKNGSPAGIYYNDVLKRVYVCHDGATGGYVPMEVVDAENDRWLREVQWQDMLWIHCNDQYGNMYASDSIFTTTPGIVNISNQTEQCQRMRQDVGLGISIIWWYRDVQAAISSTNGKVYFGFYLTNDWEGNNFNIEEYDPALNQFKILGDFGVAGEMMYYPASNYLIGTGIGLRVIDLNTLNTVAVITHYSNNFKVSNHKIYFLKGRKEIDVVSITNGFQKIGTVGF